MREVDDAYVLLTARRWWSQCGSWMRGAGMIHDGNGGPVGQRPGFLINDDERAAQAVARLCHTQYGCAQPTMAKRPVANQPIEASDPSTADRHPATADVRQRGSAHVAAAYAEYDEVLTNRWRRQW